MEVEEVEEWGVEESHFEELANQLSNSCFVFMNSSLKTYQTIKL